MSKLNTPELEIDFAALAEASPDFALYYEPGKPLDWNNPDFVRQLTITLMEHHFKYKLKLPDDRLCPPVQNRLNYLIWLQKLIDSTDGQFQWDEDPGRKVIGLDIGTGCCSIYPLIGCALRKDWNFLATDIDENNIRTATENVELNQLQSRIQIEQTKPFDPLFPLDIFGQHSIDFTMCNPPFYSSQSEMMESAKGKAQAPSAVCTGTDVEMITPGGEVAFVTRMIEESLKLGTRVKWYTSMLGKLSSVSVLVEKLRTHRCHNYAMTALVQGKTKRWAIGWSWGDLRPGSTIARAIPGFPNNLQPFPTEFTTILPPGTAIDAANDTLNHHLNKLPWYWKGEKDRCAGLGFTTENVWSRQARRKMQLAGENAPRKLTTIPNNVALGVRIELKLLPAQPTEDLLVHNVISWIQGTDQVLFESFCGMVKRVMDEAFAPES